MLWSMTEMIITPPSLSNSTSGPDPSRPPRMSGVAGVHLDRETRCTVIQRLRETKQEEGERNKKREARNGEGRKRKRKKKRKRRRGNSVRGRKKRG